LIQEICPLLRLERTELETIGGWNGQGAVWLTRPCRRKPNREMKRTVS
jgi:hypothetical protein